MSATKNIILPEEFNAEKLSIGKLKILSNQGKIVTVYYDGRPFYIQTPKMVSPFGLNKYEDERTGTKYSMDLSFKDKDTDADIAAFYDMLHQIDEKVKQAAEENSVDWWPNAKKQKKSRAVIDEIYTASVRQNKKDPSKYPETFRANVPKLGEMPNVEVFDENDAQIEDILGTDLRYAGVIGVIQMSCIWLAGAGFGSTYKLIQMQVFPVNKNVVIKGFSIRKKDSGAPKTLSHENEDDDDEEEAAPVVIAAAPKAVAPTPAPAPAQVANQLPDSDAEDEDDEEEEEEEKPIIAKPVAPVRAKAKVAKKPSA